MSKFALSSWTIVLAILVLAVPAGAEFGVENFDVTIDDSEGVSMLQAGAHPFSLTTSFELTSEETSEGGKLPDEPAKDLYFTQIDGLVGNPTAVPRCATVDFLTPGEIEGAKVPSCPDSSAVGVTEIGVASKTGSAPLHAAVYNLEPAPGFAAKLGFWITGVPVAIDVGVAESPPYNIVAEVTNISQLVEVTAARLSVWGVPADPIHDPLRGRCLRPITGTSAGTCPADIAKSPFLTLPRSCGGPLATKYEAASWLNPFVSKRGFSLTHDDLGSPRGISGCGKLDFGPEVSIRPTSLAAESSSGLEIGVDVADEGVLNPAGIAAADIEATEFALPAGVTANPSAAEGLGVCAPGQFQAASLAAGGCPESSKLGTVEVDTPILENHTLHGALYLAEPRANPFGSLLAAYLFVRDEGLGIFVKLPVRIDTDPASGQIVTRADDMPPFPLERVRVRLRQGPRAPLVTPPSCGTHRSIARLTPSSGASQLVTSSSFMITSGPAGTPCLPVPPPFHPALEAGSISNAAGAYSPFVLRLTRADGEQDFTRFSAVLPPGVVGKIAGLLRCSDSALAAAATRSGRAELANPSCPATSQVGRVVAGAGVGTALTYVPGSLYLAGPFRGAPLSVAAIVPAVAGPFDVGTIVTRVGLSLNSDNGRVEVDGSASDPIPHILEGIPLRVRDIRVYADRPNFTINPTSCAEMQTTGQIGGGGADPFGAADDSLATATARYQAASCGSLAFKPKLALSLLGGTKRSANTALRAVLTPRVGDANLKGAVVVLPPSQFIDNSHIENPCTRAEFAAGACPPSSVLGRARAFSPLLDQPLEGPVYFRANGGQRDLPDVVAALHGEFDYTLVIAVLSSRNGRVRTKVLNAPDAPVSKFVLKMAGGKKGLLENSRNLCARKQRADLRLSGQNGRAYKTRPVIKTSCRGKKR